MLTLESFTGPWAGLPVAWSNDNQLDEATYRRDVERCCRAGVPGVYTAGTSGEFYAMEFDEFARVTRATVEVCKSHNVPSMIGCTSTYTLGAVRRAALAAELGADAIQVALPFWMEIPSQEIVPFFVEVAHVAPRLALSVYETTRAKRVLTLEQHLAIKQAVPSYLMVKANAGTLGCNPMGCEQLSEIVNVFVGEGKWHTLCPVGAKGGCSSMVYWNPRVTLRYWSALAANDEPLIRELAAKVDALFQMLHSTFADRGLTDTAYDRLGGLASGFLQTSRHSRAPYPNITDEDIATLRGWYEVNFPEMLEHE